MQGSDILKKMIGCKLESGIVQSFYLKGELVDRINVTFLKFGDWIRIVSTDEMTNIKLEKENIQQVDSYGDEEINYPLEPIDKYYPDFSGFIGKELVDYKELVFKNNDSLSFGLNLYFEGNMNFIVHNQDYPIDRNEYLFENHIPKDLVEK